MLIFSKHLLSQNVGILYDGNKNAEFTYLKTVFTKIENEYPIADIVDYCKQKVNSDYPNAQPFFIASQNMFMLKANVRKICDEQKLDFAIVLMHTPLHPDQAANSIGYKMSHRNLFGVAVHSINKKGYIMYFYVRFKLYSRKLDDFIEIELPSYSEFEADRAKMKIVDSLKLNDSIAKIAIKNIQNKVDWNINRIIPLIKSNW